MDASNNHAANEEMLLDNEEARRVVERVWLSDTKGSATGRDKRDNLMIP